MFKRSLLSLVIVCSLANAMDGTENAVNESPARLAALRSFVSEKWTSCANSQSVAFATQMINPKSYVAACKDMYNAGFKNALSTLKADHKAAIAGTAVLTTAAVVAVAYYNGWFTKAKNYISSFVS